mgnify:CR=1 FL=1
MIVSTTLRKALPYGMWTTKTGEEVLFNRDYDAIWVRQTGKLEPMPVKDPQWVNDVVYQDYFFNDDSSPFDPKTPAKEVRKLLDDVLDAFSSNKPVEDVDNVWKYGKRASRKV